MKRCVVIGGGIAGLAAALRLSSFDCSVTVLDAAPALGGRVRSFTDRPSGQEIDNGQHVLMGCCTAALQFLAEASSPPEGLQRLRGFALPFAHLDGRRSMLQAGSLPHPLSLAQALLRYDMLSFAARLRVFRLAMGLKGLWQKRLARLDRRSAVEWLRRRGQKEEEIQSFWRPVLLATMNTEPEDASAKLFAVVLKEIFLGSASAADMLLPTTGLSRLFIDPARVELERRGGVLRSSAGATSVDIRHFEGETLVSGVRCDGRQIPADVVVSAIPPWAFSRLALTYDGAAESELSRTSLAAAVLPGLDLEAFRPSEILSVHVWLRRDLGPAPMTGLLGTTLQWVFSKGETEPGVFHYSCTVSSARGDETDDERALHAMLVRELRLLDAELRDEDILRLLPIREKRATFVPRPGLEALRPKARTSISGFYLAGDWTDTRFPATIEGAVRSGFIAADAIINDKMTR